MKKFFLLSSVLVLLSVTSVSAEDYAWKARWISKSESFSSTNSWIAFRKKVRLETVPRTLEARIAADSKYWLWINGEMVVFEGGLKRGPSPGDGYFDKLDIAPWLHEGENQISVLVWYFGKSGMSHMGSGIAALLFEAVAPGVEILSGADWEAAELHCYGFADGPWPNWRLPESSLRYDAAKFPFDWYLGERPARLGKPLVIPIEPGEPPFGRLVERPVPLWKDYGLSDYPEIVHRGDTLVCTLPYNAHYTPWLKVKAPAGKVIDIFTDHRVVTGTQCVWAQYVTRSGEQEYESLGWMNGEKMYYVIPEGVEVLGVKYRETGYDTGMTGYFRCDDPLLNEYWTKGQRTLKVCMRDTWYDCPDRERAQWWGDEVNELGAAFYALSPSSHKLALKGIHELASWRKPDGAMHSPVPGSNYYAELPMQILASTGWYGFHNFYWYSGDSTFVADVYPAVREYLHGTWKTGPDGMPLYRKGQWDWPDAGDNCDREALLPLWYYLALKGELSFAKMLSREDDARLIEGMMENIAQRYDALYWTGNEYRSKDYKGLTDDRVHALAVVGGIASEDKYPAMLEVFSQQAHATTYMFKYVLEALCKMGRSDLAIERMHRFYPGVMAPGCSTLWEHWNYEGSCNHAWTASGIMILSGKVAGIEPVAPGFSRFRVSPDLGPLKSVEAGVDTVYGLIEVSALRRGRHIDLKLTVPEGTEAVVPLPRGGEKLFGPGTHSVRL